MVNKSIVEGTQKLLEGGPQSVANSRLKRGIIKTSQITRGTWHHYSDHKTDNIVIKGQTFPVKSMNPREGALITCVENFDAKTATRYENGVHQIISLCKLFRCSNLSDLVKVLVNNNHFVYNIVDDNGNLNQVTLDQIIRNSVT